jgi:ankyrin repeat protein
MAGGSNLLSLSFPRILLLSSFRSPATEIWALSRLKNSKGMHQLISDCKLDIVLHSTVIHNAILRVNSIDLETAIQLRLDQINEQHGGGQTPLHLSIRLRNVGAIRTLLKWGANPNSRNQYGGTPLHVSAMEASVGITSLLLDAGADPNAVDGGGNTPLHYAVTGAYEVCALLLERGADPNIPNARLSTPLNRRCGHSQLDNLSAEVHSSKVLWSQGRQAQKVASPVLAPSTNSPEVSEADKDNEIFKLLIENGANVNTVDAYQRTILHYSACHGNVKHLKYLRSLDIQGIDPDALDTWGQSPTDILNLRQASGGSMKCSDDEATFFESLIHEIRERNWHTGLFLHRQFQFGPQHIKF